MLQYKSYNRSAITHPGYVFSIVGFALLFGLVSTVLISPLLDLFIGDEAYKTFSGQIISSILTLLLPAWLTENYFRRKNFTQVYRVHLSKIKGKDILYGIILLLCLIPITSLSTYIMEMIPIPTHFEEVISEAQETMDVTYRLYLLEKRPLGILLSFISIVIIAPISEEYFFRGGLQGWMLTNIKNVHVSIWIIAIIFGVVHLQWSGSLSRILSGAIIGYSALYGGIEIAILVHLLNNLFAFALAQITGSENVPIPATTAEIIITLVLVILAFGVTFRVFNKMRRENLTKEFLTTI